MALMSIFYRNGRLAVLESTLVLLRQVAARERSTSFQLLSTTLYITHLTMSLLASKYRYIVYLCTLISPDCKHLTSSQSLAKHSKET